MHAARWRRAIRSINDELHELYEVRELREARRLVAEGDPLMRVRNSEHLERLLGAIPKEREERAAWRQAASTVECYRQTWAIDDTDNALGELAADAPTEQAEQRRSTAAAAETYAAPRRRDARRDADASVDIELTL